jgi:hypothetical protein
MNSFRPRISAQLCADTCGQRFIPGRGQTNTRGYGGGRPIVANPDWAIGHFQSGDTKSRDPSNEERVDPAEQIDLFFKRHLTKQRINAPFNLGWRR